MARCSKRAASWLQMCTRPGGYYAGRAECVASPYHPKENPNGFINMCLAESRLVEEHIHTRLTMRHAHMAEQGGISDYGYASAQVVEEFETALVQYLSTTLRCDVPRESLVLGAGAGSMVESIVFSILDPGEGIMIPTPYYPGFLLDLGSRTGAEIVPVPRPNLVLEEAALQASFTESHVKVRSLLLTSPCNPTAQVMSEESLMMAIDFAVRNNIEIICDEVYAGSVHEPNKFISALEVARRHSSQAESHCHVVWGLAKDFPLAGLRVGCGIIQDPNLRAAAKVCVSEGELKSVTGACDRF